jgi:hypothetical protein
MLRLFSILLFLLPAGIATAHLLPEEADGVAQLGHQLASPHHLPLIVTLLVVGILVKRAISFVVSQRRPTHHR